MTTGDTLPVRRTLLLCIKSVKKPFCLTSGRLRVYGFTGSLAAMAAAFPIWIFNPVSDLWYYAGTIAAFIGILFTVTDLIRKYNILATRKLPQFDRRGGDDNA